MKQRLGQNDTPEMLGYGQDILECSPVGAFGRESLVKAEFNVERMGVVCQRGPNQIPSLDLESGRATASYYSLQINSSLLLHPAMAQAQALVYPRLSAKVCSTSFPTYTSSNAQDHVNNKRSEPGSEEQL